MAFGDIKTFTISYPGLELQIDAIDMGGGKTQFVVKCISGYADINALYWGDDVADGSNFDLGTKKDNSLNMNGSGVDWDGGVKLSDTGLGSAGVNKSTYLTAGETLNAFEMNVNWDDIDTLGVRATSTSTAGGSIKGVDTGADVTTAPSISVDDAACVVEGGNAEFAIKLDHAYDYDIKVYYTTGSDDDSATEGDDYSSGDGGFVIIKAGDTSATVTIQTTDDSENEPDHEHFTLTITKAEVNLDGDDTIELDLSAKIVDPDGEGCIIDNDDRSDGGDPTPDDHFPEWGAPSISHVTFYFETGKDPVYDGDTSGTTGSKGANDPDGWFTVKFDDNANLSDDLDDWFDDALAYIATKNPDLDTSTLKGVSIKGGTKETWYDIDNDPNDVDTAPSVWTVENKELDQAYVVTGADPFTVS